MKKGKMSGLYMFQNDVHLKVEVTTRRALNLTSGSISEPWGSSGFLIPLAGNPGDSEGSAGSACAAAKRAQKGACKHQYSLGGPRTQ